MSSHSLPLDAYPASTRSAIVRSMGYSYPVNFMSKSVWFMTKIKKFFDSPKNADDFKDFNERI
jgi:hypothetical protein